MFISELQLTIKPCIFEARIHTISIHTMTQLLVIPLNRSTYSSYMRGKSPKRELMSVLVAGLPFLIVSLALQVREKSIREKNRSRESETRESFHGAADGLLARLLPRTEPPSLAVQASTSRRYSLSFRRG